MTPVEGSDCLTGKEQFTREGAEAKARALRAQGFKVKKYRGIDCCGSWHVGHPRRADKRREQTRR